MDNLVQDFYKKIKIGKNLKILLCAWDTQAITRIGLFQLSNKFDDLIIRVNSCGTEKINSECGYHGLKGPVLPLFKLRKIKYNEYQ